MSCEKPLEEFGKVEAKRRFETALGGAFNTPPTSIKDIPPKRPKAQRKRGSKKP
jgi:hypothetical protein